MLKKRYRPEDINAWLDEYNIERPHGALAGVTPARYVKKLKEKTRIAA